MSLALPDIATALQLNYICDDEPDSPVIKDSSGNGFDLTLVRDYSFDGYAYPRRVNRAGRKAWLFTRAHTSGTTSVPTNYASRAITGAQLGALVGASNGHNGEHTVAAWIRRTASAPGEGTGIEYYFALSGQGVLASTPQDTGVATSLRQGRSVASGQKFADFFSKSPNNGDSFSPAFGMSPDFNDRWFHCTFVVRADVAATSFFIDFYKNGVLTEISTSRAASWAFTGALPASAVISLSALLNTTDSETIGQCGASIRNVMLYSRALAPQDVAALFASTLIGGPLDQDHLIR